MTTSEFAKLFAKTYNVRQQDADTWVRSIFEFLCEQCALQPEIRMTGLGTLKQIYSPPRKYTDLNTGELKVSEPRMNIQFSGGPKLDKLMKTVPVPAEPKFDKRKKSDLPVRGAKKNKNPAPDDVVISEQSQAQRGEEDGP